MRSVCNIEGQHTYTEKRERREESKRRKRGRGGERREERRAERKREKELFLRIRIFQVSKDLPSRSAMQDDTREEGLALPSTDSHYFRIPREGGHGTLGTEPELEEEAEEFVGRTLLRGKKDDSDEGTDSAEEEGEEQGEEDDWDMEEFNLQPEEIAQLGRCTQV